MALSNIQELVERSIYEAIRLVLVAEGYLPDITLYANTQAGYAQYVAAMKAIANSSKGFCVDLYGAGSSQSKGAKATPRITIESGKVMPGDIGLPFHQTVDDDPLNPGNYIKVINTAQTSHLQIDLHLVSSTAAQDRILNAVKGAALGVRRVIPLVGTDTTFFVEEFSYYDLPNSMEGINERVYSFEAKDLYLFEGTVVGPISKILEIHTDFIVSGDPDSALIIEAD